MKSPRRAFLDEKAEPLRLCCSFNKWIGCGRRKFTVCDWDGDGKADILCNGGPNVIVYRQVSSENGTWRFKNVGLVARRQLSTHDPQPAACDFNGDGIPDLVFGAMDGYIYYLRNPRIKGSHGDSPRLYGRIAWGQSPFVLDRMGTVPGLYWIAWGQSPFV